MAQDALTDDVKSYLNITWSDDETDAHVARIIANMRPYVANLVGASDVTCFDKPGLDQSLFLSACFYEWNNSRDEFLTNCADDIRASRNAHEVEHAEKV